MKLLALLLLCFSAHAEVITWRVQGRAPAVFVAEINRAMGQWELAAAGEVEFVEVAKRQPADVLFYWDKRQRYAPYYLFGVAIAPGYGLQGMVAINPYRCADRRILRTVLLHEIGHILGIATHSSDEASVMYFQIQYPKVVLTETDAEALKW